MGFLSWWDSWTGKASGNGTVARDGCTGSRAGHTTQGRHRGRQHRPQALPGLGGDCHRMATVPMHGHETSMGMRPGLARGEHDGMASKDSCKVNDKHDEHDSATRPRGAQRCVWRWKPGARSQKRGRDYRAGSTCSVRTTAPSTPTKSRWKDAGSTRTRRMPEPGSTVPDS